MRVFWLLLVVSAAGCRHPTMLKKFSATTPARESLRGRSVFVAPFSDQRVEEWDEKKSKPLEDPKGHEFKELTSQQMDAWEQERDRIEEKVPKEKWSRVGHKRNVFGAPIEDVYSVTTPEAWLTESTRVELKAQGANVVESGDADLVVQAVLRHAFQDLYMATWVHLVADVTTTLRGQAPQTVRIHALETRAAWSGNEVESLEVFTAAEQKFSRYVIDHLARVLASPAAAGPPPAPP